jgi:hypothetical protein
MKAAVQGLSKVLGYADLRFALLRMTNGRGQQKKPASSDAGFSFNYQLGL